jgi:hypothetical protein
MGLAEVQEHLAKVIVVAAQPLILLVVEVALGLLEQQALAQTLVAMAAQEFAQP